jgi:hypothetical protein
MADKYLKLNTTTGNAAEQEALASSAGAGSAGKIPALDPAGRLASNMMPIGIVAETVSFVASENLTAGNFVNLYLDTVLKGRKADNSNARRAHCFVSDAVTAAATGTGFTEGVNDDLTGMTVGAENVMLGTAGGVTETVPAAGASVIVQHLGIAKSATELIVDLKQPIERAA